MNDVPVYFIFYLKRNTLIFLLYLYTVALKIAWEECIYSSMLSLLNIFSVCLTLVLSANIVVVSCCTLIYLYSFHKLFFIFLLELYSRIRCFSHLVKLYGLYWKYFWSTFGVRGDEWLAWGSTACIGQLVTDKLWWPKHKWEKETVSFHSQ